MDIHSNLEYLCRVCAANTKGKNSVAECVYILKTAGLKDKLDKFLYLKISENDSLPKVLCKSCFRQVEATASLSKIAKHTQQVFRDFLLSNLPKGPCQSTNTSEFTSSDFLGKTDANEKSKRDEIMPPPPPPASVNSLAQIAAPISAPPLLPTMATTSHNDEVVVNVSVADPLTRDNQQKMISNSQRRQSLLLESRYTPKSIAQKTVTTTTAAAQKVTAPKSNKQIETANTTNSPQYTMPTLNFYPMKTQQQQMPQTTQITTFSSGGYVIGRINTATTNDKEEPKKMTLPLAPTADNVLQQKRKNLVKALNNIKANNSGQVSLLKSSQQKQIAATQSIAKTPLAEVVNQVGEDELPERIIIAAPKNKSSPDKSKKEPLNLSSKIPAKVVPVTQPSMSVTNASITAVAQQQQEQSLLMNSTPPKPAFPEDILLGRVIRDMDLLKLILKALKWPVNKQNMELQLQRLKNSKFIDIMSDANLLQDTDLTQLLGPYLAPVLLAAQALQQQQQQQQHQQPQQLFTNTAAVNQNVSTAYITPAKISALEAAQAEINKSIPYKLPPETSVQLVPATPEETETTQSPPLTTVTASTSLSAVVKRDRQKETKTAPVPQKRQRRAAAQRARDSIVISDEEEVSTEEELTKKSRQRSAKSAANIQIDLNTNFMSQFNLLTGSGGEEANEALLALLQRQKAAIMKDKKVQRRRRNSVSNLLTLPASEFDALIDLDDDIVLMEPVTTTSTNTDMASTTSTQEQVPPKIDITNTFLIPSVPLITRPIIKRRKTVIHSSRGRLETSMDLKNKEHTTISSSLISSNKEKRLEETINQVATGHVTFAENTTQQNTTKASSTNENSLLTPADLLPAKATQQQKKVQSKATLGQQLLEAIGLQKISPKIMNNPQTEAATSSTLSNAITVLPNSKQSIQQIRSALKKSLKQAQEQQQQRKKEMNSSSANNTIIQDADSTTKPVVKEIVVVEGKGNKSDNGSSMVDVEEQIDKVTLMVRKNDKDTCEQPTSATTNSERQEKKEFKKSSTTKIQERRRTMPLMPARGAANARSNAALETKEKCNEKQKDGEAVENNEIAEEKLEKEDSENANISSSSAAISISSNETNVNPKEEVVTPKRRGRKRLVDKQIEMEAAEANEKELDHKTKDEETDQTTSNTKNEEETASNKTSGRPTRQSKTLSKYYKGPDKPAQGRRCLPSRTTRNRKYS